MVKAFEPVGEKARWKVIYDMLRGKSPGDVISYPEMGKALGLHPAADRHAIQMAVRRAAQEYEVHDLRVLDAERGVGYRVVEAPEQLGLARRHQKKAGKALQRGQGKVVHVDLSALTPELRHAFQVMGQAFQLQADFNRRFVVRQRLLETAVREIMDTQAGDRERSGGEISELRTRLERLEAARKGE